MWHYRSATSCTTKPQVEKPKLMKTAENSHFIFSPVVHHRKLLSIYPWGGGFPGFNQPNSLQIARANNSAGRSSLFGPFKMTARRTASFPARTEARGVGMANAGPCEHRIPWLLYGLAGGI